MKTNTSNRRFSCPRAGLPKELHEPGGRLPVPVADFRQAARRSRAGDLNAITSAEQLVGRRQQDQRLRLHKIGMEIDDFYRPLVDAFNAGWRRQRPRPRLPTGFRDGKPDELRARARRARQNRERCRVQP